MTKRTTVKNDKLVFTKIAPKAHIDAQNRRCVEAALDMMWRKTYGLHLTNFDWGEKPEGYGRTRVTHPKI